MTDSPSSDDPFAPEDLIGDSGGAGLFTFGIALTLMFFAFVVDTGALEALVYGLLVGGLGQTLAGVLSIVRKDTYLGNILIAFGIWLIGFQLLSINPAGSADTRAYWSFAILIPSALLAVPAVRSRATPIIITFASLLVLNLVLGFALLHPDITALSTDTGVIALIAALPVFYLGFQRLLLAAEPEHVPPGREFDEVELEAAEEIADMGQSADRAALT